MLILREPGFQPGDILVSVPVALGFGLGFIIVEFNVIQPVVSQRSEKFYSSLMTTGKVSGNCLWLVRFILIFLFFSSI